MFGEVFYGGHITDDMDRRCCTTYLEVLIKPAMMPVGDEPPQLELVPGFKAPMPVSYDFLKDYIETSLPPESPIVYGMHPNAELSLLTSQVCNPISVFWPLQTCRSRQYHSSNEIHILSACHLDYVGWLHFNVSSILRFYLSLQCELP